VLEKLNTRYSWDCADLETDLHNILIEIIFKTTKVAPPFSGKTPQ
jgi:hypothetical protein